MSTVESIAMMSESDLMRRGSVSKQQIVEALVATRKQLREAEAKKSDTASLEEMLDRKLGPLLGYITEIRTKMVELGESVRRVQDKCIKLEEEMRNDDEAIFREFEERHRRRKYLIISGLRESSGSLEERRESDRDAVKELADEIGVKDLDLLTNQVSRIGPLNTSSSRPRLLRVKCDTMEDKFSMLRLSKKLRNCEEYQGIYVNLDLTLKQRELGKIQRQELKRRREAGEDVVIRRGQIIVKQNFQ